MRKHQTSYYLYVNDEAVNHVKAWFHTKLGIEIVLQPTSYKLISVACLTSMMSSSSWNAKMSFQEMVDTISSFAELAVIYNPGHTSGSYVGCKSTWKRTTDLFERIANK